MKYRVRSIIDFKSKTDAQKLLNDAKALHVKAVELNEREPSIFSLEDNCVEMGLLYGLLRSRMIPKLM